jgi:hypothetical protein
MDCDCCGGRGGSCCRCTDAKETGKVAAVNYRWTSICRVILMKFKTSLNVFALGVIMFPLFCSTTGGQSNATLSGPVLGYIFNAPEGKLRPVRGVVGSATIGDPEPLDFAISQALTLDSRHVAVSTNASPELLLVSPGTSPTAVAAISGIPSRPSLAAASVHGTAAAFYYAGTHTLLTVSGLPDSPKVSGPVDLSSLNGDLLTHVALSDDGILVVYSVVETDRESLYVWTATSASSRFVFSVKAVGGIAITGNGSAIVTDRSANEVFAIVDARNTALVHFLLGEGDGLSNPTDVAVSSNNQIFIANRGTSSVIATDPNGRFLQNQTCACQLTGLNSLRDSVFLMTDRLDRTVYLLDTTSSGHRILFIPPLQADR